MTFAFVTDDFCNAVAAASSRSGVALEASQVLTLEEIEEEIEKKRKKLEEEQERNRRIKEQNDRAKRILGK